MKFFTLALAGVTLAVAGCNTSAPNAAPGQLSSSQISPVASTQPVQAVAQLSSLTINKADLDALLYESYGLRMTFDLVEFNLAKEMLTKQGKTVEPADVQRERQMILSKICGDAAPSSYEDLFNQFLDREHLSRAEFDLKVIKTDACLRKIVEPIIIGKLTEATVRKGYEQLYGAKRQIADIELSNIRDARLLKTDLKPSLLSAWRPP